MTASCAGQPLGLVEERRGAEVDVRAREPRIVRGGRVQARGEADDVLGVAGVLVLRERVADREVERPAARLDRDAARAPDGAAVRAVLAEREPLVEELP